MQIGSIVRGMIPANDWTGPRAVQLAVVRFGDAWRILVDGQKIGRFARHADAVQCALDIARETREEGRPVEVLSQGAFGEVSLIQPGAYGQR